MNTPDLVTWAKLVQESDVTGKTVALVTPGIWSVLCADFYSFTDWKTNRLPVPEASVMEYMGIQVIADPLATEPVRLVGRERVRRVTKFEPYTAYREVTSWEIVP